MQHSGYMNTGLKLKIAGLAAGLLLAGAVQAVPVGYTLDVTTFYCFCVPGDLVGGAGPGPDTGYFQVKNNGASTFSGTELLV